ncbi:hypothetical protein GW17_00053208, partial [Ensete ventricosum]
MLGLQARPVAPRRQATAHRAWASVAPLRLLAVPSPRDDGCPPEVTPSSPANPLSSHLFRAWQRRILSYGWKARVHVVGQPQLIPHESP